MSRFVATFAVAGAFAFGVLHSPESALAQGKLNLGAKKVTKAPPPPREEVPAEYKDTPAVLRFKMHDIDGKEVDLKTFKGNVIVMVNTASECGYKDQLGELQEMYAKHKDQGFVVLAFPSNDFEGQEPKQGADLKAWCTEKYKVTFNLFERVEVKNPDSACDLYKFLADKKKNSFHGGPIKWNFTKFVIDRKGEIRGRFEAAEKPSGKKMTGLVERLLKVKAPGMPADKTKDGEKTDEEGKDAKDAAGGGEKKAEKPKAKNM